MHLLNSGWSPGMSMFVDVSVGCRWILIQLTCWRAWLWTRILQIWGVIINIDARLYIADLLIMGWLLVIVFWWWRCWVGVAGFIDCRCYSLWCCFTPSFRLLGWRWLFFLWLIFFLLVASRRRLFVDEWRLIWRERIFRVQLDESWNSWIVIVYQPSQRWVFWLIIAVLMLLMLLLLLLFRYHRRCVRFVLQRWRRGH